MGRILEKIKRSLNKKIRLPRINLAKLKEGRTKKKELKQGLSRHDKDIRAKEPTPLFEMAVSESKFFIGPTLKKTRPELKDLPWGYQEDKIVLQTRDPWWIHAYWEITLNTWQRCREQLGNDWHKAKRVLRIYDVSHIIFDGTNANRFFDIEITSDAKNWYIDTGGPGRSWCVDLGLKIFDRFITIVRSNTVLTPLEGPSWITDEEWMIPEEMFSRLYGLSVGLGPSVSSPVGKLWQLRKALASGALASPGLFSMASPVKKGLKERKFWLVVNTELIVYGATEPDAKVTVQGQPIKLRPDGTFSLRFALPDGKQVIPVKAISADEIDERAITPIVVKETK